MTIARVLRSRGRAFLAVATSLAALVAAGCSSEERSATTEPPGPATTTEPTGATTTEDAGFEELFAQYEPAREPDGDLAKVVWPDYVLNAPPEVKELYEFQVENGDLMRWMPCFCGCGQSAGHRSNRDCYIRKVNPDGSVVFDPMAPT